MQNSKLKCDKCGNIHIEADRKESKSKMGKTACPVCGCVFSKVINVKIE